jgi:Asp-tRNA(Asn)/Glu-tRNA(Gln) amidotransferase A subunit family amidase
MRDVAPVSLASTVGDLRTGRLDLHEHIDALLDRIEAVDPALLAVLPEPGRRARLHAQAAELLDRHPSPDRRPPLFGALVGVKDVLRVDGMPTLGGSSLPAEAFAGPEAAVVRSLRGAGALVLGKTRTAEFAYAAPGPTRNPHDHGRTPGGSSHGSAAGVAAGFFPLALGTQTIGSIVRPAAFCGVAGYVPTYGRVAAEGTLFVSRSLDRIGLLAADAESLELAASTLVASWHPVGAARQPSLGVAGGPFLDAVEPAARELFERQVEALGAAGYRVCGDRLFEDAEEVAESLRRLMNGELAREHAVLFERYRDRYRAQSAAGIEQGMAITDEQLAADRRALVERRYRVESHRRAAGIDLWITPAALGPAPVGIGASGSPWPNLPWSYLGLPAVALPAGTLGGLPVGLQLVAGWHADEELLQWSARLAASVEFPSAPAPTAEAEKRDSPSFSWY